MRALKLKPVPPRESGRGKNLISGALTGTDTEKLNRQSILTFDELIVITDYTRV